MYIKKNFSIIFILIILFILVACPVLTYATNSSENVKINIIDSQYKIVNTYNADTNKVTVTISSNIKLLRNKDASWKYSDDNLSISKEYSENTNYYTILTDQVGNSKKINIVVSEIEKKELNLKVANTYNAATNKVTVTISSNLKLLRNKDTSWKYSDDNLSISKVYSENTNYNTTITDQFGNSKKANIIVNEIQKQELTLKLSNKYNTDTNKVTVTISSNLKLLKNKDASWKYSNDSLSISKEYSENTNYYTTITDQFGNSKRVNIAVKEIVKKELTLKVANTYNAATNKVTVTISSNIKLLKNKDASWKYSDDSLSISKEYSEKTNYYTTITDILGNSKRVNIIVNEIQHFSLNTINKYNAETNTVVVTIISNVKLLPNKDASWKYSDDLLSVTKEYKDNTNYNTTITDMFGKSISLNIIVNEIDKKSPNITVDYSFNNDGKLKVILKSNEKLLDDKNIENWSLSDDKLSYSRVYNEIVNEEYQTKVRDIYNNETSAYIKINIINNKDFKQIDNSELNVKYTYCSNDVVYVILKSSVKLQDTKTSGGWQLSSDRYSYVKGYTENTSYQTSIKNINGNTSVVPIVITNFKNVLEGIDVSSYNNIIDWGKVKRAGNDFTMIRAGFRGYRTGSLNEDEKLKYNVENANANGIKVGLYFYSQAINESEAIQEADFVLNLIKKYDLKINYPIAIDVENTSNNGRADNISIDERTKVCIAFYEKIKSAGYIPMVYSNKVWLSSYIDTSKIKCDIWLAQYNNAVTYNGTYTMWQYTSSENIDGIVGRVDKNHLYKKY